LSVTVRLPGPLRDYAEGVSTVSVEAATVADVLRELDKTWPAVGRRITDEQGAIRRHVHVFVGDERVRLLTDAIADGTEVTIMAAVSGG
jgi:molybdopterin converting factor small subunit